MHLKPETVEALKRYGNGLSGLYGLPVYLVGSSLIEANEKPRDYDVRIEMPDEDFTVRFGDPKQWVLENATGEWTDIRWKWSVECTKQTKVGWRETLLNIDFQIYPESYCHARLYDRQPRLRLDTRPKVGAARAITLEPNEILEMIYALSGWVDVSEAMVLDGDTEREQKLPELKAFYERFKTEHAELLDYEP